MAETLLRHARDTQAIAEMSGSLAQDVANLKTRRLPSFRDVNRACRKVDPDRSDVA